MYSFIRKKYLDFDQKVIPHVDLLFCIQARKEWTNPLLTYAFTADETVMVLTIAQRAKVSTIERVQSVSR